MAHQSTSIPSLSLPPSLPPCFYPGFFSISSWKLSSLCKWKLQHFRISVAIFQRSAVNLTPDALWSEFWHHCINTEEEGGERGKGRGEAALKQLFTFQTFGRGSKNFHRTHRWSMRLNSQRRGSLKMIHRRIIEKDARVDLLHILDLWPSSWWMLACHTFAAYTKQKEEQGEPNCLNSSVMEQLDIAWMQYEMWDYLFKSVRLRCWSTTARYSDS